MNWLQIGSALFLLAMVAMLFPRAREAIKHSPKGSMNDWMGYIVPMALVALFIVLLILLV
ncbi:MAG: hypothetical protein GY806_08340 [Gammaproteobacteria bacterium]|nr:hypothetical protein [Gammaproteobacteria bacterium]